MLKKLPPQPIPTGALVELRDGRKGIVRSYEPAAREYRIKLDGRDGQIYCLAKSGDIVKIIKT